MKDNFQVAQLQVLQINSLLALTQLVLTHTSNSAIDLQTRQGEVVRLSAGILPHLFNTNVSPSLLFIFGWIQRPCGCRPNKASLILVVGTIKCRQH